MEFPITTDTVVYAVIYLLSYRLSIILLGAFSIYLGYRLFTQVLPSEKALSNNAELEIKAGITEFGLKKAAPGTFFAAFGTIIVITILASAQPEFVRNMSVGGVHPSGGDPNQASMSSPVQGVQKPVDKTSSNVSYSESWRGDSDKNCSLGKLETLQEKHQYILSSYKEMLDLAEEVVDHQPDDGQYRDTLAELYFINNYFSKALETQEKALKLLPSDKDAQRRLKAYRAALEE